MINIYQASDAEILALLHDPTFQAITLIITAWSLVWKGIALWKAAQRGEKWWYIPLLIINTVGILEIIYIFFFAGKKEKSGK